MRMLHRRPGAILGATALLLLAACTPPDGGSIDAAGRPGRPADGLLHRADLQHLVELGLRRDAEGLIPYLADPDPVVRARAAFTLGSVQDTAAAPALLTALHDLDPRVRADAAFAVGQLPMAGLATPLFNVLKVEWDPVARSEQLEAVGKRCEEGAARRLFQVREAELGPDVARAMARCVLAGVERDTLWTRLAQDLTHPDPGVREWSAYAFGRDPDPRNWFAHRPAVRAALRSYEADDPAAMHLARALGRTMDRFSLDLLGWWARNGTPWQTRANAVEALARSEFMQAAALAAAGLDDPSVHVRLNAIQAVSGIPPTRPLVEQLRGWVQSHPDDVAAAAGILPLLAGAGDGETLEAWFRRDDILDEPVLMAGIAGAAALEGERGVELLSDGALRGPPRAARQAMGELRERWSVSRLYAEAHPVFLASFTRLASAPDSVVRAEAADALRDVVFTGQEAAFEADADADAAPDSAVAEPRRRLPPAYREVDWDRLRALGPEPRLHLETERGTVVLALRTEEAPLTVDAIAATAQAGSYDGVPFHRVVPNFVAQGGDVSRGGTRPGAGFRLRSEFTRVPYRRGVLGMASAGKDTETTQFFITHSPQPHLDGGYTAFGTVVQGMEVLDALAPEHRVIRAWVTPGGA